ncbi:E3 ubiquitin-protein ligase RNF8-like isoform X2 [Ischnura elegans]|nr:E3 ubiquitin-protein ligase RNF8-like isoform X2 [Ischnura elegans]
MEATEPPTRILNLSVLMGEKCHLAGQCQDEIEEVPVDDEPSNEEGPTVSVQSSNGMVNSASTPDSEIHEIIEEMATANEHTDLELRETKRALREALLAQEKVESANASLEKQLLECYQREENNKSLLNEVMENELQCSICNEIIMDAVTISCSHSYCSQCLITWRRNQNICPMCRKNITYEVNARMMNDAVEKIIKCLPEDVQKRRAELVRARRGAV